MADEIKKGKYAISESAQPISFLNGVHGKMMQVGLLTLWKNP